MFVKGSQQLYITILPNEQSTTQLKLTKPRGWRCAFNVARPTTLTADVWRAEAFATETSSVLFFIIKLEPQPMLPPVTSHETFCFPFFGVPSGAMLFWECTNVSKGLILIKSPFAELNQRSKISILLKIPQRIENTGAASVAVYSCSVPHASQAVHVLHH